MEYCTHTQLRFVPVRTVIYLDFILATKFIWRNEFGLIEFQISKFQTIFSPKLMFRFSLAWQATYSDEMKQKSSFLRRVVAMHDYSVLCRISISSGCFTVSPALGRTGSSLELWYSFFLISL